MNLRSFVITLGILSIVLLSILGYILSKSRVPKQIDKIVNGNMKLTSSAISNNQSIPVKFTCDGQNINPPLSISGVPDSAESLALIMVDPDAPAGIWVHWILWNIDPTTSEIEENNIPLSALNASLPKESNAIMGANVGVTSFGKPGYGGPCPPSGTHHYLFHLYALDSTLSLNSSSTGEDVEKSIEGHILDKAELVGLYSRN